ncbi:Hsp90 co-chaperone Cdc37 [Trichinella pseudospiralis]|uniref:Hsp90 co-chaperone Cdc37 n=1 Tax=Trichinella pseudospiralis TaxID=6337 RepID=A0A0V1JC41_TRIPS|nr:Hsp90 co-chaperone Cdc37 [Trichinella pseudospiralis]KRZ32555.1 Hsp90 co-chaperone Cdc37 [Trichinella pseudospiralis]KRZ40808.1 Hsp90 co-chaperone Cdc37 [Trichinella pseudospiralis]
MPIDYSKWKDIELSDDEDDLSPHFERNAFFEMRHRVRLERMEMEKEYREEVEQNRKTTLEELQKLKEQLGKEQLSDAEKAEGEKKMEDLNKDLKELDQCMEEIEEQEKKAKWNVDTISKPGFERSSISKTANSNMPKSDVSDFTDEEVEALEHFCMLQKFEDSLALLLKYPKLCCDASVEQVAIRVVSEEINGNHEVMEIIAHQQILLCSLVSIARMLNLNASNRKLIRDFFTSLMESEAKKQLFMKDVEEYIENVRKSAKECEEIEDVEIEENLTVEEVLNAMPPSLRQFLAPNDNTVLCDEEQDISAREIYYHLKRAVAVGLWNIPPTIWPKSGGKNHTCTSPNNQ